MDPVLSKYQRDLNCTADADRSTRTRSLKKLDDALFGRRSDDLFDAPLARSKFLEAGLLDALLHRLDDPIEKNREVSLGILRKAVEKDELGACKDDSFRIESHVMDSIASRLSQVSVTRVGETPFPEESEEIRLCWSETICILISHPNAKQALRRELSNIVQVIAKSCSDTFPDNKKQAADCCVKLCESFPDLVHLHMSSLLTPIVANMNHQHSKVRQSSLQAIKSLTMCCAETCSTFEDNMKENILPVLRGLNHDRSSAVRIQGMNLVSDLLLKMPNSEIYRKDLLPVILFGLADPATQIQQLALSTIEGVGEQLACKSDTHPPLPPGEEIVCGDPLPEPFENRPGVGARSLVIDILPSALPVVLREAEDWTAQERFRAVSLLRSMLVYAENKADPFLKEILKTLFVVSMDEEQTVRDAASDCGKLLGRYIDSNHLFGELIPYCLNQKVREDRAEEAPSNQLGALSVFGNVVLGFPTDDLLGVKLERAAGLLGDPGLCESDTVAVHAKIFVGLQNVMDRFLGGKEAYGGAFELGQQTTQTMLRTLFIISTSPGNADSGTGADPDSNLAAAAVDAMGLLAACAGFFDAKTGEPDLQALVESCCAKLIMESLAGGKQIATVSVQWTKGTPSRRIFDQVVRETGAKGLDRQGVLSTVVDVFVATCPAENDAELRLCMLSLLENMILSVQSESSSESYHPLDGFAAVIIDKVLLPGLIWRAGRVASTIRKVSMFCLSHFLASSPSLEEWFQNEMQRVVPTLKACLDDMDTDTRRFTCSALGNLFKLLEQHGKTLDAIVFVDIYHDVIKRWDDADDRVRLIACTALRSLVAIAPLEVLKGTPSEYITDTAFIHMDDTKPQIQQAVFDVVAQLITRRADVKAILSKAETHRARHRSPDYCDKIIALCTSSGQE